MNDREKRFPALAALGDIWPFLKPEWGLLLMGAALAFGLTAAEVTTPVLLGLLLDSLLAGPGAKRPAVVGALGADGVVALLIVGALLGGFFISRQGAVSGRIGHRVTARMRDAVWEHLQRLPLQYTRQRGAGRLMMRFLGDARAVQRLVSEGFVRISQDVLLVFAVVGMLFYIDRRMGLIVFLSLPLYATIFWYSNGRIQRHSRETRKRRTRLSGYLGTRLSGMEVVKAHGRARAETQKVQKLNRLIVKHGTRLESAGGWLEGASHTVLASKGALVLLLAASELSAGRLSGGQLVSFFTLLGLLSPVLHRITLANRYLQEAQISIERLTSTLAEAPETDPEEGARKLLVSEGTVRVQEASFSYPDGTPVLNRASMVARRGEIVAVLGENGSGKSTLLNMLARFLEADSGRVLVDGQDLAETSARSVRAAVGLVAQEPKIFEGTVRENVAYGARSNVPREQVELAMQVSGVHSMGERLPEGLETRLREGQRELSLAERQKVSLARTLAVAPPILALDEPCSGLDHRAEAELATTLRTLARDATVIVATHSPLVLLEADRVYRLEEGRLREEGLPALYAPKEAG